MTGINVTETIKERNRGEHWLICGSRRNIPEYKELVFYELDKILKHNPISIIEGCCPDSADSYAEEWAIKNNVPIQHHPSHSGNYLRRNIEMVDKADNVIAFWDGFSYGTAHTIATATAKGISVIIIDLRELIIPTSLLHFTHPDQLKKLRQDNKFIPKGEIK